MRCISVFAVCLVTVFTGLNSYAQTSHELTRWKGGHTATVSLTYDDGYDNHVTIAGVLLNERNLKGSFYPRADWFDTSEDWEMWRVLAAQGHEIGSHSVNHFNFPTLTEEELRFELSESKAEIERNVPSQSCLTIAYPDGFQDPFIEAVVSEYYIGGRSIWVPDTGYVNYYPGEGYPGVNFYRIASKRFDEKPVGDIIEQVDLALATNAWLCVHSHNIHEEYASGHAVLYDYILARDIWVDTVETVVRYMQESINSVLTIVSESGSEIILSLTHSLDNDIYDEPLTIRSTVPLSWAGVYVRQGGSTYYLDSAIENTEAVVYYNAQPNGGLITLSPSGSLNQAPHVAAGLDQTIYLPQETVFLNATVTDDGLPDPPAGVAYAWNQVSGPATVIFCSASTEDTTATFPVSGTYVLELTADDGELTASDELTIMVVEAAGEPFTAEVRIAAGYDDAEERSSGSMYLTSSDLELVYDGSDQTVGLRFAGVDIPQGAIILNAYIQFQADETGAGATSLVIKGQDIDDAPAFDATRRNISSRAGTLAGVPWSPEPWTTVREAGPDQQTPNIASVIQEIVDRSGWWIGNALAVIITGTGERTAVSYDRDSGGAPLLHVEYNFTGELPNRVPIVAAGPDRTLYLPEETVFLDATVTDDGLPDPPAGVTSAWNQVSGPTTVIFGSANEEDTAATFPVSGTYVLELTADDGELTARDELTIMVVEAGEELFTAEVRVAAGYDDAEERSSGSMYLTSSDLELVYDGSDQTAGLRFAGVDIPRGATILSAYIQFQADETSAGATSLMIKGQDIDDAPAFDATLRNISSRARTLAEVPWSPGPWTTVGEAGPDQQTPNIASVIQEIMDRSDWWGGNALAVIITGTGERTAVSYDRDPVGAPLLYVEYIFSGELPNRPPTVAAGPDQTVYLPEETVFLDATVTDDGLPDPPAEITCLWTQVNGPDTVSFTDVSEVDTTAVFPGDGTYVLQLTAEDGEFVASDEVTVVVVEEGGAMFMVDVRVSGGYDDAEERSSGGMYLTSSDLELAYDGGNQTVGMRFADVDVPQGAAIINAYVQFKVDETSSGAASLVIEGQDIDNAPAFGSTESNISSRVRTLAGVLWSPLPWTAVGEAGPDQQTPDISSVIQEIVDRPDWLSGNALAVVFTGTGERVAESYNGDPDGAPLLHVDYYFSGEMLN